MKNKYTLSLISTMLVGLLVLAPVSTFAKDNKNSTDKKEISAAARAEARAEAEDEKDENKSEDKEDSRKPENKSCLKAIGHLIAPGWIKHNGQLDLGLVRSKS